MSERYRIRQDGMTVASAEGVTAMNEIIHYASLYASEGPLWIERHNGKRWKRTVGYNIEDTPNDQ